MRLLDILRYTRKHGSVTEASFINQYLIPKINELGYKPTMDRVGNIWVETDSKHSSPFLFVAHIDTCHQKEGMINPIVEGNICKLSKNDMLHGCLGADDGVGIYCNLKMIEAKVSGTFLFTRGEERGGIGAGHIGKNCQDKLEGFKLAVEVDRAGTDEIIISQAYGKCASSLFAYDLGEALGMGHKPSELGTYTDCSEFAHIIPECVNISAGYERQHTVKETVDLAYVDKLVDRLLQVDWHSFKTYREAGDFGESAYDDDYYPYSTYKGQSLTDLEDYVTQNPIKVATYLHSIGVDIFEIEHESDQYADEYWESELGVGMW